MHLIATPLSDKHLSELRLAVERAQLQWLPKVDVPKDIVVGLERIILFLRQNGGAAAQARQVASLAFIFGEQVVRTSNWQWRSVSEDGSVNPSLVSADDTRAVLVVDVVTKWVMGLERCALKELFSACIEGRQHADMVELVPEHHA